MCRAHGAGVAVSRRSVRPFETVGTAATRASERGGHSGGGACPPFLPTAPRRVATAGVEPPPLTQNPRTRDRARGYRTGCPPSLAAEREGGLVFVIAIRTTASRKPATAFAWTSGFDPVGSIRCTAVSIGTAGSHSSTCDSHTPLGDSPGYDRTRPPTVPYVSRPERLTRLRQAGSTTQMASSASASSRSSTETTLAKHYAVAGYPTVHAIKASDKSSLASDASCAAGGLPQPGDSGS
jgi:hypothetical protein